MRILNDEEIYSAVTHGFSHEVRSDNLTDEIALKRHEAAKTVAEAQHQLDLKEFFYWGDLYCVVSNRPQRECAHCWQSLREGL